ncbi:MAG TPA: hypothetical protein VIV40_14800 [Kofleriaceae bacterium]
MNLPKATASGPAAATPDAVRPVRVALGAGVIAALYLVVIYLAHPVPTGLLSMLGGAKNDVERYGGLEMVWLPPPGMDEREIVARFHVGEHAAQLRRDHDAFVIGVPRVRRDEVAETASRLGGEHNLEFHVVVESDAMKSLASTLGLPIKGQRPIDIDIDQWRGDEDMETHTDYYLFGDTRERIDGKLEEAKQKGWTLPADLRIAYEYVEGEKVSGWRTYVIEAKPALGGESIANAVGAYDPNTNRPIVMLDFTREGGRTFGDVTARIKGHKLAVLIGDQVYSAPIINGAIRGGRASVTMGGSDPQKQERERDMLVNTLKAGALPQGGQVVQARYVEAIDDVPMQWLARGIVALAGGGLIALLAWIVVRVTRPVRRRGAAVADGAAPWHRVLITALAPLAIYVVSQITIRGINAEEFVELAFHRGWTPASPSHALEQISIGSLGIGPVINAFIFVEILSLIVPSWRRRRHAGPDARRPLTAAVIFTAATLVVLQSWFVTQYLMMLGEDVMPFGMWPRVLVIASFAIGTLALVGVAALIREHGLGNGYAALIVGGWLIQIGGRWLDGPALDPDFVVGGATILAIAIPLAVVVRWRIARVGEAPLRVPSSSLAPLGEAGGLVVLFSVLSPLGFESASQKLYEWIAAARTHQWVLIGLVAAFTVVWSYAFARPAVTRKLAERVGVVAPSQSAWWAATALSCALLLGVGAVSMFTSVMRPTAAWLVYAMTTAIVAMAVLDMYDDFRGRRTALERVWSIQQPQHADLISRALDEVAIPHHLSAANLRTLLAFFGPFAPIDVYVAAEHAPAARAKIRELVE